ncbi:MAG: leucine-rich repeat domain-containing protein [Candidatus Azobacteroides sp.]|nr:leucine-rich repeat domain-containing protein [Candidatus Azobacteroides sp.]
MELKRFIRNGITLIIIFVLFSVKLSAQDTITFTWQAKGDRALGIEATEDFTVNWGDGTIEKKNSTFTFYLYHTYTTQKEYTVTIATSTLDGRFTTFHTSLSGATYYQISSLTLTGCHGLQILSCWNNQLTHLDLTGCPDLQSIDCENNQLTGLDLTECPDLQSIDCRNNQLTGLDLSGCRDLQSIDCRNNQLTRLDLSGCPNLTHLGCSYNQITGLDLSGCPDLQSIDCGSNQLTHLDLTGCPNLRGLNCGNNQLTHLDLSGCPNLQYLACNNNQLIHLDLNECPYLQSIDCNNNQLTHLDLTGCPNLQILNFDHNQLTEIDLTGCPNLRGLNCGNNQLQLSDLFAAHLLINNPNGKRLGTQNLQPQTAILGEALFSEQSVFNGIFTNYSVIRNGNPASESDYTVIDGKLIFNAVGKYTVTITNDAIVSNENAPAKVIVEITVEEGTGIAEYKQNNLTVYPNPATAEIHVKLNSHETVNYAIYNPAGQPVLHGRLQGETTINVESLSKGVYYINFDGERNTTVSFIKN